MLLVLFYRLIQNIEKQINRFVLFNKDFKMLALFDEFTEINFFALCFVIRKCLLL